MLSLRCFADLVNPGMLLLGITVGVVNCLQPIEYLGAPQVEAVVSHSISAEGSVSLLREEPQHFFPQLTAEGQHDTSWTPAHFEKRAGRSLVQKIHQTEAREDRMRGYTALPPNPSIIMFEDKTCDTEIGGVFLPMNAGLEQDSCTEVTPIDELSRVASNRILMSERNGSLKIFTDVTDIKRLHIVLHFGNDCLGGEDDFMKVSVDKEHFKALQEGECIKAYNQDQVQTLYLMMLNTDSIDTWPAGMNEKGWLFYAAIITASVILLAIIILFTARLKTKRQGKQMLPEEEEEASLVEWSAPPAMAASQSRTRYTDNR